MNKTMIIGGLVALTAIIASPVLAEAITGLTSTTITVNGDYDIDFTLAGPVVTDGSDFGGYAIFTENGDVIAVTSHKGVYDSEGQQYPNKNKTFDICNKGNVVAGFCDAVWHAHLVKPVSNDACQIAAVGALTHEEPGTVSLSGNVITLEGVPIGTISYTNSIDGSATDFTTGAAPLLPNPVSGAADGGVAFDLVGVFDGKAKDKNLVAVCIGPAA